MASRAKLPEKYKGLFEWLRKQQRYIKEFDAQSEEVKKNSTQSDARMDADRRQRLVDLGVDTSERYLEDKWEDKFELLQQYKAEYGDCE